MLESMEDFDSDTREKNFFELPEIKKLLGSVFGNIEHESDRGAVLIAQELIDNELTALLRATAPDGMSKEKVDSLLGYPGVLATFSAKADVAYFAGLITSNLYESIHILRKIRNTAAHGSQSFSLEPHRTKLVEVYRKLGDFGETQMEDFLRYMAIKLYIEPLADSFLEKQKEDGIEEMRSAFKNREEIIEHIGKHPEALKIALDKLAKVELGLAVVLLRGLIIFSGDRVLKARCKKGQME